MARRKKEMTKRDVKVVQIVGAERGWHIHHAFKDGSRWLQEVTCWGLMSDGSVRPLVAGQGIDLEPVFDPDEGPAPSLLSPVESWSYKFTSGNKPEHDWEAFGVTGAGDVLWRRPIG
jgi:hypothetical protein